MSQPRPETLSVRQQEAVANLLELYRARFTGSWTLEFNDGVPQLGKETKVRRFGPEKGPRLTAGR